MGMAISIKGARVNKHHLRGMLTNHIAGHMDDEVVHRGPLHEILFAAFFIASGQVPLISLYDVQHSRAGTRVGEAAAQCVSRMGHPVFSHQPIHILVPSGNRPGDSACGIPGFFAAWKMSSTWMASLNHSQLSSLLVVVKEKLLVTPCFPT